MLRCMSPDVAPLRHAVGEQRYLFFGVERKLWVDGQTDAKDPERTYLRRIAKGLQPGSLSQNKIDLLEKTSSSRFVLQKKVVPPGKRYEASAGDSGRHLTARFDRGHKIVAHMHDERWRLHLREQFAHIEISQMRYFLTRKLSLRLQVMRISRRNPIKYFFNIVCRGLE